MHGQFASLRMTEWNSDRWTNREDAVVEAHPPATNAGRVGHPWRNALSFASRRMTKCIGLILFSGGA